MSEPWLTENDALLGIIEDRIRRAGKITFAEFMETALYHPELGYYNAAYSPIGERADYVTSPETSVLFGRLVARHLIATW
ncbi:MAG: SAM-dependent methyltransferase, partial [Dehalococcoidia bacterium]|nr:SAM-dependent methyltransferase [Dehalococcoidia bacterium]